MGILDKLFGRTNSNQNSSVTRKTNTGPSIATIDRIINDYGQVLEKFSKGCSIIPISVLPHDKEIIKGAIKAAIKVTSDKPAIEILKVGYINLATFVSDDDYEMAKEGKEFLFSTSMDKSKMVYAEKYLEIERFISGEIMKLQSEINEYCESK